MHVLCFSDGDCEDPIKTISDYGQIASVDDWLASQEVSLIDSSSLSCGTKLSCPADESDEEVDIVSTFISPSKGMPIFDFLPFIHILLKV